MALLLLALRRDATNPEAVAIVERHGPAARWASGASGLYGAQGFIRVSGVSGAAEGCWGLQRAYGFFVVESGVGVEVGSRASVQRVASLCLWHDVFAEGPWLGDFKLSS